ncbi:hypothetical protein Ocin01_01497 [Orchesella cincta]|uniref:Uncharacterized protein n=1 Tax=Orchesella cincta TaxID=48709 RepID=A0A1D2NIW4_ORCCI|nr:hypothetical protein Ocin01_01497 [Orchesella cincta]
MAPNDLGAAIYARRPTNGRKSY